MILADKIINERKRNGWSQEELADKLGVSRQSVSKWEGAQSVPDIQKILQMAEIFGVSTDYLLKDEIEATDLPVALDEDTEPDAVRVSMEEANEYIELEKKHSPWIANGVSLCITCAVPLVFLAGLSEYKHVMSENAAGGIGVVMLFVMIISAVCIFMKHGKELDKYKKFKECRIDTAYGVTGMVKERQKAFEHKHDTLTMIGVIMCISCAIPVMIAAFAEADDFILICMICILLIMIGTAVNIFIRVGSVSEAYQVLLQEEDFTYENKIREKKFAPFSRIYWTLATVIFLAWSFTTGRWGFTWIVWPIAGVLFVVYKQIVMLCINSRE